MKFSSSSLKVVSAPAIIASFFAVGCARVDAQAPLPAEPSLAGKTFKITIIENLDYLVKVNKEDDGNPTKDQITGYMKDMIDGVAKKAQFEYELFLPSGYGSSCIPTIEDKNSTDGAYAKKYRSQFNCGQEDVIELGKTDMYWSLYYVSTPRQRWNQFTLPYKPPGQGALTMYGTATNVVDIYDMIKQQASGAQKPVCIGESTAYGGYLKNAFKDLKVHETPNTNEGFLGGLRGGHCDAIINAYPYATNFIAEQFDKGECTIDKKPIGVVGNSLGFGLSQFAVGISRDQPVEVTEAISYWLNVLMTCAPGDESGVCPSGSGLSLFELYSAYGRDDPAKCGYAQSPATDLTAAWIAIGCIAALAIVGVAAFWFKRRADERRLRKRFVEQVARNISIGASPGSLTADELAKEIDHIGSGDGKITKEEMKKWLDDEKLGKLSDKDFEMLWGAMDADGSGEVDAVEFCVYLSCCGKEFEKVHVEQASMTKSQKANWASKRFTAADLE